MLVGYGLTRFLATVLRRPSLDVVLAVSPLAWRRWQRALMIAVTLGSAGAGLIAFGIATGAVPAIVFGAIFLAGSWALRVRAIVRWWIGVRYQPARDEVVVGRVSAGFDDDARRLFTQGGASGRRCSGGWCSGRWSRCEGVDGCGDHHGQPDPEAEVAELRHPRGVASDR